LFAPSSCCRRWNSCCVASCSGARPRQSAIFTCRTGARSCDHASGCASSSAAALPDCRLIARPDPGSDSCSKRKVDDDVSLPTKAAPNCRTLFFINRETGKLATFITTVSAYHEEHGVRPEMATATAERRLHRRVVEGCATDIYIYRQATRLTIEFAHGRTQASGHVVGGRVSALLQRSRRDDLGLFDC
jgi:hypothetical protein